MNRHWLVHVTLTIMLPTCVHSWWLSERNELNYSVPRVSLISPDLFVTYAIPLTNFIRKHLVPFHFFADDGQLYTNFNLTKEKIEAVIVDIINCLLPHMLMFNGGKQYLYPFPPLQIDSDIVHPGQITKNLGVIFDQHMTMKNQLSVITQCCFFHVQNISKIKCYFTERSFLIVTHAFIINKPDENNFPWLVYQIVSQTDCSLCWMTLHIGSLVSITLTTTHITLWSYIGSILRKDSSLK